MSTVTKAKVKLPIVNLIETDGEPLESDWHRAAIAFLIEIVSWLFRDRTDYYVGGNMFIYYSEEQARTRKYRGPDFFYVDGVNRLPQRPYWVVWREGGRYPDVIIELLSKKTAKADRTTKKTLYERTFRTHEYFCYDPRTQRLEGWRLGEGGRYLVIQPNEKGWLWSEKLELWLGAWKGSYLGVEAVWLRYYHADGRLILTRAEDAEREVKALQARMAELQARTKRRNHRKA
jgi:Uma2 family endonuclease